MRAVQIKIDEGEIEQLVTLLILVEGGQADPRRINRENLIARIFGTLNTMWLCGAAILPRIEINLGHETVTDLVDILAELGDEPVRSLFRGMRRLVFDQELIDTVESGITIISFRNPRLVKASIGSDFQGSGALLIEVPELRLDDVAGQEPIKAKLRRQASLLRDNRMLSGMGLRPPGGMLLFGLPGTGKTLLARAFAGETGFPFLAVTGPELMDLSFQKKLFEKLRRYAPAVLFVDEIDALGRRGAGLDPAINALLSELDGFSSKNGEPLFVIGATNLKQKIDPALLRPGRMELVFEVKPPDRAARRFLFQRIVTRLAVGVSEDLIDYSYGMTGAQIEAACREIVLMDQIIDDQTARKVLEEQMFGELITDLDQELYETIAYHEAGHAVAMIIGGFRVSYVSLTAREGRAGHVWAEWAEARVTQNATTTRATIAAILAGRVAQCIHHGDDGAGDSGAAEDLRSATRMAYIAVGQLGLDPEIGLVSLPKGDEDGFTMPFLAQQVEKKVTIWLTAAEQEARSLLIQNWSAVEEIAGELLKTGALAHTRLAEVMKHAPTITKRPAGRSSKEA
jgi:ATP-dependent Zn protease